MENGNEADEKEDDSDVSKRPPNRIPVTSECILEKTLDGDVLVEIDKTLVKKLKPHQVEGKTFK